MRISAVCLAVLLFAMGSLSGCATMMGEKTQQVNFKTKPSGAEVVLGAKSCVTPCTMVLEKNKLIFSANATKDGYQSQKIDLNGNIDQLYWLNLFNLGFGCIVDMITGTWIKYETDYYTILARK